MPKREAGSVTQCVGKKRYATIDYAEKKADELGKKYDKPQRPYYCGICNGYHCTTKVK